MLYVSRYANKELTNGKYTPVRISIGTPRWPLGYELAGAIKELMPFGSKDIADQDESRRVYHARLDKIGFETIAKRLKAFEDMGKPVVLLCYEDIRKGPDNWCHRTFFAEWWLKQTGEKIEELPDPSGARQMKKETLQLSLF